MNNLKNYRKAMRGVIHSTLAMASTSSYAFDWSDTSLGYRYGSEFREPYNPNKINKNILSLTYASGYSSGAISLILMSCSPITRS